MVVGFARIFEAVELFKLGVSTNWFGIACPHHCYPSSVPSLLLAFILGLIGGILITLTFGFALARWILGSSPSGTSFPYRSSSTLHLSRLRGYLHE